MKLTNYRGEDVFLIKETREHISDFHPEITISIIRKTLKNPIEVRQSSFSSESELYYLYKAENRFYCVVVKACTDGNFISTALTTSKIKFGKLIFKQGE